MSELLEVIMLVSFSVGWYCSIAKMILTGRACGKSLGFVGLVCFGYLCGVLAKLAAQDGGADLPPVTYVYAWNFLVTAFDGWLVVMLNRRETLRSTLARA